MEATRPCRARILCFCWPCRALTAALCLLHQDLKKQTAIRLAQEQKQHHDALVSGSAGFDSHQPSNFSALQPQHGSPAGVTPRKPQPVHRVDRPVYVPERSPVPGPTARSYAPSPSTESALMPPPSHSYMPHHRPVGEMPQMVNNQVYNNVRYQPESQRQKPVSPHPSLDSVQQAKSKLPHGLTVSELKEMTKARLQAEALQDRREVASTTPVPPFERAPSVSPHPGGMMHAPLRARAHSSHSHYSQDSRADTWENGSVSTVASDYLGSESAYGVGSFCGDERPSPCPFNRHPSFQPSPGGPVSSFTDAPPTDSVTFPGVLTSNGFHLDGQVGGYTPNRRRAATLSPKHGLGHLDEHRQVFVDGDAPGLPSFSASTGVLYPRGRGSFNNGRGHVMGNNFQPNRSRASSATSLPPISHTAEEFEHRTSLHRTPSAFGALREDAPSPAVTGLAENFREPPVGFDVPRGLETNRPRVPTYSGIGLHTGLGSLEDFGDPRGRAATWAGSSMDSMFGPGLIGASQDGLCDDLASILKLTGSDEQPKMHQLQPPPGL